MRLIKSVAKILFLLVAMFFISEGIKKRTHSFTIANIICDRSEFSKKQCYCPYSEKVDQILNQEFTYLDRGTQFYAFESMDKKHVIKFIRMDRLRPKWFYQFLLFPTFIDRFRLEKLQDRERKRIKTFDACYLAYERLKDQTGLIYVQLSPSDIDKSLTIYDKLGRKFTLDLDNTCFAIQKKVKLLPDAIKTEDPKQVIDSFIEGITYRCKKGVSNTDPNVFKNFGFLDGKAIEVDFGDFFDNHHLIEPRLYRHEIMRYVEKFRSWAIKEHPLLISYFDQKVQNEIEEYKK